MEYVALFIILGTLGALIRFRKRMKRLERRITQLETAINPHAVVVKHGLFR